MSTLNIGQVAKATGISVEAIRFYEKRGLIDTPARTATGYRQYPPETVKRIRFILHAKDAGFTLSEISDLLRLRQTSADSCANIRDRALSKIEDVDNRLNDLHLVRDALSRLVARCDDMEQMGECPIIEALELEDES